MELDAMLNEELLRHYGSSGKRKHHFFEITKAELRVWLSLPMIK